jgi:hypothetical protein
MKMYDQYVKKKGEKTGSGDLETHHFTLDFDFNFLRQITFSHGLRDCCNSSDLGCKIEGHLIHLN